MPDLKSLDTVYLVLAFIVPGLIITFARAQFITGRIKSPAENSLIYLALSAVYYGIALPGLGYAVSLEPGWRRTAAWFGLILVGPAISGVLLGCSVQLGWGRWLWHKLRLNPVHASPTAWDWRFSAMPPGGLYVLVTLSGSTVAGVFGDKSFASSDPAERDLYIEEIWDVSDSGEWTARPRKVGILIPGKEIKTVEMWDKQ
jgi:hypothetical protein